MKVLAKPIEMISWTEQCGKIHPLKFKIIGEEGKTKICPVVKLYNLELDTMAGNKIYKFTCEIVLNQQIRLCELRYELDTCLWT
ncbi:MAG: hypothetical protein PF505_05735, partial [Vallitaleaceae bacterium]|nr:hypothetical protein [Vallitaleaceae bacterium]